MPHSKNFLLNRLDAGTMGRLSSNLIVVNLPLGEVLAETHARVEKVYFPHSGIISCVVETVGGGAIETGMIGNDGAFGGIQALDDKVSLNHVVIQGLGDFLRPYPRSGGLNSLFSRPTCQVRAIFSGSSSADRGLQRIARCPSPHLQVAFADA